MRITIITKLGLVIIYLLLAISCNSNTQIKQSETERTEEDAKEKNIRELRMKADSALIYSKSKGLNTNYCILIDFSIHSGKNRMFVWDFIGDSIKYEGLCCHGIGKGSTPSQPVYSNEEGSLCTSLGRYKITNRYISSWGIKIGYQLYGLDITNSNALKRIVTLHSHTPVPTEEVYPRHLPMGYSHGCTVISDSYMYNIDKLLKDNTKSLLLWIYE